MRAGNSMWLRRLALLLLPGTFAACGGPERSGDASLDAVTEGAVALAGDVTVSFQRGVSPSSTFAYAGVSDTWLQFGTARVNGLSQEACRDFGHATMSIASISQAAETALIQENGQPVPNNTLEMQILPTWELLFNHYVTRKGRSMPSTAALLPRVRAGGASTDLQMSWETLTHADVGSVGLEP